MYADVSNKYRSIKRREWFIGPFNQSKITVFSDSRSKHDPSQIIIQMLCIFVAKLLNRACCKCKHQRNANVCMHNINQFSFFLLDLEEQPLHALLLRVCCSEIYIHIQRCCNANLTKILAHLVLWRYFLWKQMTLEQNLFP